MTYTTIKRITAAIQVGKGKDLPREELYIELSVGNTVERSPVVQMTKKGSFNHTFTSDLEAGELLTLKIIRNADQSVHGTLELTYEEVAEASGKVNYDFMADGHKVGAIDLDITVMARVHTNVIDSSIDFLASPLPWFLKAEDIYGLAKKGVTYAHSLPYTDKVVDSLESLTEALLQHTALIHPDEGSTCLTALDDLVAQTLATADDRLDNGRMRVLDSVRGLINAMERNVTEQREKIQNMATDLQGQVKSRVSSTVTMTQEKMMTTLALYEERYPSLAAKARSAIAQAHSMALGAQQLLTTATEYYASTKNSVNEAYTQTQATVQKYYDAVTDTVVKAPGLACQTLDQGTELVRDLPLVGVYAAPCMSTAAGVIRYFANAPPAATTTAVAVDDE